MERASTILQLFLEYLTSPSPKGAFSKQPIGKSPLPFLHQDTWSGDFEAPCPPEAISDWLTSPVESAITVDWPRPFFSVPITDFSHGSTPGLFLGNPNRIPCPPSTFKYVLQCKSTHIFFLSLLPSANVHQVPAVCRVLFIPGTGGMAMSKTDRS